MPDSPSSNPWDQYEARLAQTQARRADLRAKFEKRDEELRVVEERLASAIEALKELQEVMVDVADELIESGKLPAITQQTAAPQPPPMGPDNPFYGKPLPECAVIIIRRAGKALTEAEIVDGLRAGGVQIVSKQPQLNVRRSMARRPDILYTKNRKWAVIETPIDGDKLPKKRVVNNFTTAHAESTRTGIEAAKARGVAWGRSPTITPEKEQTLLEMRKQGFQVKEIAQVLEVSRTTLFNYLREHGLTKEYNIKDRDDQPPKNRLI